MNDEVKVEISGDGVVGTNNDARLALLAQINDQNDELRGDELEQINDDGTTEPFVVKTAEGEEQQLTNEAKTEEINQEGFVAPTEPKKVIIKVNGVEKEITQEELIARAQKIEAADQYLAEAARIRQEALKQQQTRPSVEDAALKQKQQEDEDLALARALQMGDEAEAVAAIRKIREGSKQQAPSINMDEVSKTIDERLTFNRAIQAFRNEYKDLVNDPVLHKMVLDKDAELIAQGDRRPYYERYVDVGNQVRAWVGQFKPAATETKDPLQDKIDRKAAVATPPKATGGKVASTIVEDKEESVSDTIANIAKARGGPQWMNGMGR